MSKLRKLRLKFRALSSCVLSLLLKPPFSKGAIFVTRKCNRKCPYCFVSTEETRKELELQKIQMVINIFRELGIWYLAIYGAEPTLRSDLADIIRHAYNKGMFIILHTNGSFENVGVVEVVEAGVSIVDVAIDSISNPKLKNYEEISETLKVLAGLDVGVKFNFCVIKENWDEVPAVVELAERLCVPISIHLGEAPVLPTNIPYDTNSCFEKGNPSDIEQVQKISDYLADKAKSSILLMHPPEYFKSWPRFLQGKKIRWECKAGETFLCVDTDGTILQCQGATFPVRIGNKVLSYRDINKGKVSLVKQELKKLTQQCNLGCLSCVSMLEYYLLKNPRRLLELFLSFGKHTKKDS